MAHHENPSFEYWGREVPQLHLSLISGGGNQVPLEMRFCMCWFSDMCGTLRSLSEVASRLLEGGGPRPLIILRKPLGMPFQRAALAFL